MADLTAVQIRQGLLDGTLDLSSLTAVQLVMAEQIAQGMMMRAITREDIRNAQIDMLLASWKSENVRVEAELIPVTAKPEVVLPDPAIVIKASPGRGAGSGAIASATGSRLAGIISIKTNANSTPAANSTIVGVQFSKPLPSVPIVMIQPASPEAWATQESFRFDQRNVSVYGFTIESGQVPLFAMTQAEYLINYQCIL